MSAITPGAGPGAANPGPTPAANPGLTSGVELTKIQKEPFWTKRNTMIAIAVAVTVAALVALGALALTAAFCPYLAIPVLSALSFHALVALGGGALGGAALLTFVGGALAYLQKKKIEETYDGKVGLYRDERRKCVEEFLKTFTVGSAFNSPDGESPPERTKLGKDLITYGFLELNPSGPEFSLVTNRDIKTTYITAEEMISPMIEGRSVSPLSCMVRGGLENAVFQQHIGFDQLKKAVDADATKREALVAEAIAITKDVVEAVQKMKENPYCLDSIRGRSPYQLIGVQVSTALANLALLHADIFTAIKDQASPTTPVLGAFKNSTYEEFVARASRDFFSSELDSNSEKYIQLASIAPISNAPAGALFDLVDQVAKLDNEVTAQSIAEEIAETTAQQYLGAHTPMFRFIARFGRSAWNRPGTHSRDSLYKTKEGATVENIVQYIKRVPFGNEANRTRMLKLLVDVHPELFERDDPYITNQQAGFIQMTKNHAALYQKRVKRSGWVDPYLKPLVLQPPVE